MPERWSIPDGERPEREFELLVEAVRLLAHDLNCHLSRAIALTTCRDTDGFPFVHVEHRDYPWSQDLWLIADASQAKTTVLLANELLQSTLFEDYETPWPPCPLHPSSSHSLKPVARGQGGVWICPLSRKTIASIGDLPALKHQAD